MEGKLEAADKATIEDGLKKLKDVRATEDTEKIKAEMEAFSQSTYAIFGKIYQQQSAENGGQQGPTGGANVSDDGTVETNFTE